MQMTRPVRNLVTVVMFGLVGFVLGCSGGGGSDAPPSKADSQKIREEMKQAREDMKAARQEAAKEGMKGMTQGRPR
jgi:hypothetical protein